MVLSHTPKQENLKAVQMHMMMIMQYVIWVIISVFNSKVAL